MTGSIDTGGQCTGACCRGFTLSRRAQPGTTDDRWPAAKRRGEILYYDLTTVLEEHQRRIESNELAGHDLIFHASQVSVHEWGDRFRCDAQAPDGRCTVYAERPPTCREFPGRTQVCYACGFSVAKRRRAVRRFIREQKIARNLNKNATLSPYGAEA